MSERPGLRATPPDLNDEVPMWRFTMTCDCTFSYYFGITLEVARSVRHRWSPDQWAFHHFRRSGWSLEPVRCPKCHQSKSEVIGLKISG